MNKPVAIVGLGPNSHDDAPFHDDEWETWGLPWDNGYWAYCDVLFEMHGRNLFLHPDADRSPSYLIDLENCYQPVWMQEAHADIPNSLAYPVKEVTEMLGLDLPDPEYFGSSPAYQIALAIYQERPKIGLWGVEVKDDIHDHQRPNLEFLLGFARGRGIEIEVHGETQLFQLKHENCLGANLSVWYSGRYGIGEAV